MFIQLSHAHAMTRQVGKKDLYIKQGETLKAHVDEVTTMLKNTHY